MQSTLIGLGYLCLVPAIGFGLLLLFVITGFGFEGSVAIPIPIRWLLFIFVYLIVFLLLSRMMHWVPARLVMYFFGASTLFCTIIYYTYNAVQVAELDAHSGGCGNLRLFPDMARLACLSVFAGVPLVSIAGLVGPNVPGHQQIDRQVDIDNTMNAPN